MIVVSDTSPLTALLTVGESGILVSLFDKIIIPKAVAKELLRSHPTLPKWFQVQALHSGLEAGEYSQILDEGESQAIALAQ